MLNKVIASVIPFFPRKFIWLFSRRYIAGETLADAVRVSKELNDEGIEVTLDLLGEFQTSEDKIGFYKSEYLKAIEAVEKNGLKASFSVKPTMFGLLIDKESCYRHIRDIILLASGCGRMVRIDMEDSHCTTLEIELFRKLQNEFPQHVGLVFQAYLHRTLDDLKGLSNLNINGTNVNIRLCKGIYVESGDIAYKNRNEINNHFTEDLDYLFRNDFFAAIATHDKLLVNKAYDLIEKYCVSNDHYEFQMLYGVTPELRKSIVEAGHHMRVYVPFGKDWMNYSTRRLKENPRMVSHIIKALFVRM